jgi:hypothetical protein
MKKQPLRNAKDVEADEWRIAYDYMLDKHIPRMPKHGAKYNAYVTHTGKTARNALNSLLPTCKADIVIPRTRLFLDMDLYDVDALRIMFGFLRVRKAYIYRVDPKYTRIGSSLVFLGD